MKIITISGVDGSGKSTQIQLLKEYLESKNKRVYYFHAIAFGIATKISQFKSKYCLICKLTGKCKNKNIETEKSVTSANSFQIILRKIFLEIDIWRFQQLVKKLEKENYDYLLSDRFFYDTIINLEYLSQGKKHSAIIPQSDLAFYLKIDPEIVMQRERKPDQGLDYLKEKVVIFENKVPLWNLKTINANQKKNLIFEEIKSYVI